ncbi:PREDICTED: G2/mitotic-specific cyclin-A-like [Branchiostoma belcheri]|uniref:G2/mitotic-specific cyclin-A-like n=1 Tax=Branchiostoma belcheri TaxID=7741 RepID=A0A6P4YA66_BRABE|nr:PREDICTED: G2/mitotic-specific cyclin-A-like [Branchiostoma belcheri]
MSQALGSFSTTLGEENRQANARRLKREDNQSRPIAPQATKRVALGVLNQNAGRQRVQPHRAAKQNCGPLGTSACGQTGSVGCGQAGKPTTGFFVPPAASTQFSIHVDHQADSERSKEPQVPPQSQLLALRGIGKPSASMAERRVLTCFLTFQLRHRPKPGYMKKQPDITNSMRCILVDWLVEVAEEYKLHNETLYLAVSYIDRFLSSMSVLRSKLQLVGTAAMFLASKYEEIYPPDVGEFVYITDDTYTKKQVLRMEHLILKVLSFDVAVPTINCFQKRFLQAAKVNSKTESLAMYLAELTLQEGETFLKYIPSTIAAASLCLAQHTLNMQPWTPTLMHYSGYTLADLLPCVQDMHRTFQSAPSSQQQAVREKYRSPKYHSVSTILAPATIPTA